MVLHILPPPTSLGNEVGQGLGAGLSQGLQTGINQGRLSSAFDKLRGMQGANFQDQLSAIAPILLTTPGGAQALEAIAPVLASQGQLQAYRKSIDEMRSGTPQSQSSQGFNSQQQYSAPQSQQQVTPKQQYREGKVPQSVITPFPERTAGPQTQPEMSPQQLNNYALSLMENALATGKPITREQANADADLQQNRIRASNQQILKEKQLFEDAQKELSKNIVARADNSGLIKDAEDRTVAEKFASEARNAANENEAYQYVRTQMRKYDSAKEAVKREVGLTNPVGDLYRKALGSYKNQEQIVKDLQNPLNKFRELGLYEEASNFMVNELGFGNELANRALWPNTKEENEQLGKFPKNVNVPREPIFRPRGYIKSPFPGDEYNLSDDGYSKFKDQLGDFLNKNKDIDLVNLRSDLNQDKRYSWQNIYNAIDDLIVEGRFVPDIEQDKQLNTIRQAPIPGLGSWFEYWWTGKK